MRRSILFIDTKNPDYGEGTGCIVKLRGLPLQLLMTCNHVIPTEDVARNSWIHFDREYTTKEENIIKGEKLFNFEYFKTSPQSELDFTVIAMIPEEIPGEREAFPLTAYESLFHQQLKEKDQVLLWHYPYVGHCHHRQMSHYSVKVLSGYLIGHLAQTEKGSSGCPLLKQVDSRLVLLGLHRGSTEDDKEGKELNVATHVHAIHYALLGKKHTLGNPDKRVLARESTGSGSVALKEEKRDGPPHSVPPKNPERHFPVLRSSREFMKHFQEKFLPKGGMVVKGQKIAEELCNENVIPAPMKNRLLKEDDDYAAASAIFNHVKEQGDYASLKSLCDTMIEAKAMKAMNKLGKEMLECLEENKDNFA
jgi:hypothetical protein